MFPFCRCWEVKLQLQGALEPGCEFKRPKQVPWRDFLPPVLYRALPLVTTAAGETCGIRVLPQGTQVREQSHRCPVGCGECLVEPRVPEKCAQLSSWKTSLSDIQRKKIYLTSLLCPKHEAAFRQDLVLLIVLNGEGTWL